MKPEHLIPYAKQSIDDSDRQEVDKALCSQVITRGEYVTAFEEAIAHYCGAKHAIAFCNASCALDAAYHVAKVGPYDRVLASPNTYIAGIAGGIQRKATPAFIDIDRSTGNFNLEKVQEDLRAFRSTRGKMILAPVHFSGIPIDMQALDRMICSPNTVVIEDAAHAIGSKYADGQKVGSCAWSHMTVFSFHPAKTITTGEGGMILTNDENLKTALQLYRNNGIERRADHFIGNSDQPYPGYYEVQFLSSNYHLTDIQAALGLSQLKRIESFIVKRRELVRLYRNLLKDIPHIRLFDSAHDETSAYHLFVVQIDFAEYHTNRKEVMEYLKEKGIGTQLHYIPIYHHPFFNKREELEPHFPEMEAYYAEALSLPLYYDLKPEEVDYVVASLKACLQAYSQKRHHKSPHTRSKRKR